KVVPVSSEIMKTDVTQAAGGAQARYASSIRATPGGRCSTGAPQEAQNRAPFRGTASQLGQKCRLATASYSSIHMAPRIRDAPRPRARPVRRCRSARVGERGVCLTDGVLPGV